MNANDKAGPIHPTATCGDLDGVMRVDLILIRFHGGREIGDVVKARPAAPKLPVAPQAIILSFSTLLSPAGH